MTEERVKHKLRGILSADVVGYSRLLRENEASAIRSLEENRKLIFGLAEKFEGSVVDAPGDNILAEFSSVVNALKCALKIQQELSKKNSKLLENQRVEFRIGINLGDVVVEDGRIYGSGVSIAARLEDLAEPAGIYISRQAYDHIKGKLKLGYEYLGEHSVKDTSKPVHIYRVLTDPESAGKVIGEKRPGRSSIRMAVAGIIILSVAVAGLIGWNTYFHRQTPVVSDEKEAPKTIAILPFRDLSPEEDQEYFSDGLADELINKLARVKDLQVTARTSSFYFKGKNVGTRTIAETLGVTYLLEGSVRKSGDQLRVTAQLIKAMDGYHLWSETYDREVKEIFTIQDDIANAVTTALSVTLGVGEFSRPGMTRNMEAYDEYLRAYANTLKYTPDSIRTAIDQLKKALDIDPGFGLGWVLLSSMYMEATALLPPEQTVDFEIRAAEALKRARAVAPNMPEVLIETAREHQGNGDWLEADRLFKQVLDEQGHVNPDANRSYGRMLREVGRSHDAVLYLERAKRLNPLDVDISWNLSSVLFNSKRIDEALEEARRGRKLDGHDTLFVAMEILVALENNDRPQAAAIIASYYNLEGDYPDATMLRLAELLLMEDKKAALAELETLSKESGIPPITKLYLAHVASVLGDAELAFEKLLESEHIVLLSAVWHPIHRAIWLLPAFKTYVRDVGIYDYWRTSGEWPDLCRPVGDDDFECN
jgi:TolB-like protein/class 3 adenylate cyclase/predicted Zn-dependent protease